jgi:oxygen-independent coproporphyrinogen-3 oxidase
MKPLGIYIHIPFCKRKCYYCDFVSFPDKDGLFDNYIDAVITEARLYSGYLKDRTPDTLFIGGGTPSVLSSGQIGRLLNGIKQACNHDFKEATIEANPETLSEEKLSAYSELGVNRLSIGLQTHDDEILRRIGRRHTYGSFLEIFDTAGKFFNNINIDTIFGLPGQTLENYTNTIKEIIRLSPKHVSSYSLNLEPGTKLAEIYSGADEETDRSMYHSAAQTLGRAGYVHYETSNFAKQGFECLHNLKYWLGEEYLGLGVAAHSYIEDKAKIRFNNAIKLSEYLETINGSKKPIEQCCELSDKDELTEYLMLRLRLKQGISFDDFRRSFGKDFLITFSGPVDFSVENGLVVCDECGLYPTLKGFDLQNTLITEFMKII